MKKIFYLFVVLPVIAIAQSQDQNYIKTSIYKDPQQQPLTGVPANYLAKTQVVYFDGLGRPIENIAYGQSANGNDIITPIEYDVFGRQQRTYLPYVSDQTSMSFMDNASLKLPLFQQYFQKYTDSIAYSRKEYEPSPLNRVLKQAAPGELWKLGSGHEVKFDYQFNGNEEVRLFKVSLLEDYTPSLVDNNTFYPLNKLYKTITKDENWTSGDNNTIQEFKDKEGKIVLKRTFGVSIVNQVAVNESHDTYYVYDDYGNLTFVIPPIVDLTHDINGALDDLCYQYMYDFRNRLIAKKLPGKQWEYIVYNNQNKPVATGPVENPWGIDNSWGWLITKYDAFGRVVYTGWLEDNSIDVNSRNSFQGQLGVTWAESFSATGSVIDGFSVSYTNTTYPTSFKLLTINYYDNYNYFQAPTIPNQVLGEHVITNAKGLSTGSWVRILETPTSAKAEISYSFYDYKARVIKSYKANSFGGYTSVENKLDFMGKVMFTNTYHKRTEIDAEIRVTDTFEYSMQDYLVVHKQKINNGVEQLIAKNDYDNLGNLISKQVGGQDVHYYVGLQKVDYQYNIRGWLKGINDLGTLQENVPGVPKDLFAFKINYTEVENDIDGEVKPLFNGNIAETFWQNSSDNLVRKYGYKYDDLNRLNKAIYQKPNAAFPVTHMYDEEMTYDKNGNIQHLTRFGDLDDPTATNAVQLDDLTYAYATNNKNLLVKVTDATGHPKGFTDDTDGISEDVDDDYGYDDNGNMTRDDNKGISKITYNHLNLPVTITFDSLGTIRYLYNAVGQKVLKVVTLNADNSTMRTDYLDGFQYSNGVLKFFPHSEGYVNVTQVTGLNGEKNYRFNYVFNYLDHLGNVRLSYGIDPGTHQLKILEQNHYYPFGLKHTRYNTERKKYDVMLDEYGDPVVGIIPDITPNGIGNKKYNYKYNGKEYQDELGLNMTAMDYRQYDNAIGRFNRIDSFAELDYSSSPFGFGFNNPVYFSDPSGLFPTPQAAVSYMINNKITGIIRPVNDVWAIMSGVVDENGREIGRYYDSELAAIGMVIYNHIDMESPNKSDGANNNFGEGAGFWDGVNDGLSSFFHLFADRRSGYIFKDGELKDGFTGGEKGKNGVIYNFMETPWAPGPELYSTARFSQMTRDFRAFSDLFSTELEIAGTLRDMKNSDTTEVVKDSILEAYMVYMINNVQLRADSPQERDSLINSQNGTPIFYSLKK